MPTTSISVIPPEIIISKWNRNTFYVLWDFSLFPIDPITEIAVNFRNSFVKEREEDPFNPIQPLRRRIRQCFQSKRTLVAQIYGRCKLRRLRQNGRTPQRNRNPNCFCQRSRRIHLALSQIYSRVGRGSRRLCRHHWHRCQNRPQTHRRLLRPHQHSQSQENRRRKARSSPTLRHQPQPIHPV